MQVYPLDTVSMACAITLFPSVCTDLSRRMIPNALTLSSGILGLVYHVLKRPIADGFSFSMAGLLLGGMLLIVPYAKSWTGGGDVKLLAAVGAWLGPFQIMHVFIYGSMAGGILSAFLLLSKPKHITSVTPQTIRKNASVNASKKGHVPYALAIAAGYIMNGILGELF